MALSRSKKIEKLSAAFARLPDSAQILLQDLTDKGVGQDAPDVLAFFNRIARRLPKDQRTVTAFTTSQDLVQAMATSVQDWALPQLAARTAAQEWNKVISPNAQDEFRLLAIANALSAADPDNLRSVPQIIHWLQTDTNRALPEDLPGIKADLKAFERIKPDLAPDARDVTAYPHIHDLRAKFPKTAYSQDQRKAYEAQALQNGEAKLLWQDEHNHACLIHITSKVGAQRLGRGTDWCTAWGGPGDPNKKNQFSEYSDNLLYLRIGAEVYQLHFSSAQFKDALDKNIELKSLITARPEAPPALTSALEYTFQTAAKNGDGYSIADRLTKYQKTGNANLLQVAVSALTRACIKQTFQMAAKSGDGKLIGYLLTACKHTGDAKLLQRAISVLTPLLDQTLQNAAQYREADGIAQLLTACQNTGDAKLLQTAITALTPHLAQTFKGAAHFSNRDMARLLSACQHTGDVQLLQTASSALIPVLDQTLRNAVGDGSEGWVTELLTTCHHINDPALNRTVCDSLKGQSVNWVLTRRAMRSPELATALALWSPPQERPARQPQPSL